MYNDNTVYIRGILSGVTTNQLREHLLQFGDLVGIRIIERKRPVRHHICFVDFQSPTDAERCVREFRSPFHGERITVQRARVRVSNEHEDRGRDLNQQRRRERGHNLRNARQQTRSRIRSRSPIVGTFLRGGPHPNLSRQELRSISPVHRLNQGPEMMPVDPPSVHAASPNVSTQQGRVSATSNAGQPVNDVIHVNPRHPNFHALVQPNLAVPIFEPLQAGTIPFMGNNETLPGLNAEAWAVGQLATNTEIPNVDGNLEWQYQAGLDLNTGIGHHYDGFARQYDQRLEENHGFTGGELSMGLVIQSLSEQPTLYSVQLQALADLNREAAANAVHDAGNHATIVNSSLNPPQIPGHQERGGTSSEASRDAGYGTGNDPQPGTSRRSPWQIPERQGRREQKGSVFDRLTRKK